MKGAIILALSGLHIGLHDGLQVNALPSGAPGCNVNAAGQMTPIDGEPSVESKDLGYKLDVSESTYTPNTPITITLQNDIEPEFKGILIYASPASSPDDTTRVGHFTGFNPDNYRVNTDPCSCPASQQCGITHTSESPKPIPFELQFELPESMGDVIVSAVVVRNGAMDYQIVEDVVLSDGNGGGDVDNGNGGACECRPRKCLRWKNGGNLDAGVSEMPYDVEDVIPVPDGAEQEASPDVSDDVSEEEEDLETRVNQLSSPSALVLPSLVAPLALLSLQLL